MIIKLYKNCILTDAYSEVFDVYRKDANGKTALDRYLELLDAGGLGSKTYNVADAYITNSGRLSFDLDTNDGRDFYQFNYMTLYDEATDFMRYCFIDAITVVNRTAVVNYVEDIWSNYAPSMNIRKSLLTRSRIIDYGSPSSIKIPFYSLGMEYQGNNQLKIVDLFDRVGWYHLLTVIVQLQLYKLTEQGEISEREIYEFYVSRTYQDGTPSNQLNIRDANDVLFEMIRLSSSQKISWKGSEWNYEIYNVLFMPADFNVTFTASPSFPPILIYEADNFKNYLNIVSSSFIGNETIQFTVEKTIPCNFKQFKIGTIASAYDIVQNGTDITIKLGYYASKTEFHLYIAFQNQIYEVTQDFMQEFPISVQTADVTQQQATARELRQFNAKLGIASGAMQIGNGIANTSVGIAGMIVGGTAGSTNMSFSGASRALNGVSEIGHGAINVISSKKQLDIANRALYTSNKGIKANSNASVNASYSIVIFEIQPDNEVEVQANIDNCGYVCNEIVDNILSMTLTGEANKWNVVQFEYVNIYGKFTQRIADALRDILYAGFKIWYDETAINE